LSTAAFDDVKLAVGSEIDGYRVERIVNVRPGIDVVVEASKDSSGDRALLTFPVPGVCASRETRRELLRLADLRSSIAHPNLAPLLVVSQRGREPYLVGRVPGRGTLAEHLDAGRPAPDEALQVLAQVAGALDAAAAQGLVHRDLTPAAIALGESEPPEAWLTDFGVMLPVSPGCGSVASLEGAAYCSPEAVRGEELTARSNVYALACILYECLSGAPPYVFDRPLLTLHAHLVDPAPTISSRAGQLPAALDEALAKGLAKDPSRRHASAADLIVHAAAALGRPVQIPGPATPVEAEEPRDRPREEGRPRFTLPRHRWAWTVAALALVASGLSGFGIGSAGGSGEPRAQRATPLSTAAERVASRQRTDYVRSVGRSVERLDGRRLAARSRLRRARGARAQAEAARALARTYRATRAGLPAPVSSLGEAGLGDALNDAERAYGQLARAARRQDLRAWRKAREQAVRSEGDIERALGRLRSGYDRA
jgi:serine/threonine protein kinase